jgi:hypothetical protein
MMRSAINRLAPSPRFAASSARPEPCAFLEIFFRQSPDDQFAHVATVASVRIGLSPAGSWRGSAAAATNWIAYATWHPSDRYFVDQRRMIAQRGSH